MNIDPCTFQLQVLADWRLEYVKSCLFLAGVIVGVVIPTGQKPRTIGQVLGRLVLPALQTRQFLERDTRNSLLTKYIWTLRTGSLAAVLHPIPRSAINPSLVPGEYKEPEARRCSPSVKGPMGWCSHTLEFSCSRRWEWGPRSPGFRPFVSLALDI